MGLIGLSAIAAFGLTMTPAEAQWSFSISTVRGNQIGEETELPLTSAEMSFDPKQKGLSRCRISKSVRDGDTTMRTLTCYLSKDGAITAVATAAACSRTPDSTSGILSIQLTGRISYLLILSCSPVERASFTNSNQKSIGGDL